MRIVVAGTGSIGRRHINQLQALLPAVRWVLLRNETEYDDYAKALQAEVVPTLAAALADHADALVIATPSAFHSKLVLEGLAASLPMYIEKPVVTTAAELQAVQAATHLSNAYIPTQVGCNLRFLPSLLCLRQLLHGGAIGQVVRASFEAGQWLPDWRPNQDHRQSYSADSKRGGGVVLDLIHEIDAARWLLGELHPVACQATQVPALEIMSEAVATALLRSETDALVQISLDYVARRPVRRYQFVGDKGTLLWDLPRQELILETPEEQTWIDPGISGFDVEATYRNAMVAFLAAARGEALSFQPLQDGLASAALAIGLKELAWQNL